MKLSIVTEAGSTRRDFLKKAGGGILSTLVSGGLSLETAKKLVDPATTNNFSIIMNAGNSSDRYEPTTRESWDFTRLMFGRISSFVKSPVNMINMDGEELGLHASISASKIAKLIEKFGIYYDDTEDMVDIHIKMPGQNIRIVDTNYLNYYESKPVNRDNLLDNWWEQWEQFGTSYIDKGMVNTLSKKGIDPTSRVNIEGPYVNAEPEDWELEELDWDDEQITPRPDDYLASPMHQPFESKLDKALGLTETQKFAGIIGNHLL